MATNKCNAYLSAMLLRVAKRMALTYSVRLGT